MYDTIHHGPQYPVYVVGLCTSYLRIRIKLLPTPGDSVVSQDPTTRLSRRTFTVRTDPVSQSISESSGGMMRTERRKSREHEEVTVIEYEITTRAGPAQRNQTSKLPNLKLRLEACSLHTGSRASETLPSVHYIQVTRTKAESQKRTRPRRKRFRVFYSVFYQWNLNDLGGESSPDS